MQFWRLPQTSEIRILHFNKPSGWCESILKLEKHQSRSRPKPQATRRNWASRATLYPPGQLEQTLWCSSLEFCLPENSFMCSMELVVRKIFQWYFGLKMLFKTYHESLTSTKFIFPCKKLNYYDFVNVSGGRNQGFFKLHFRWNNGVFSPNMCKALITISEWIEIQNIDTKLECT